MNEVRETPGWGRIAVQIDSGAMHTVGSKDIQKAFAMKETLMSKKGIGYAIAKEVNVKYFGEENVIG